VSGSFLTLSTRVPRRGLLGSSRAEGPRNFRADLPRTGTFVGYASPRGVCSRSNQQGGVVRHFYPSRREKNRWSGS
jgi:hypothetical protein